MSNTINIGTRRSKLALWQAYYVQDLLEKAGLDTNIVEIETKGDKILDVSIAKIGSKGVFTEEIEEQLRNGAIEVLQDMPRLAGEYMDNLLSDPDSDVRIFAVNILASLAHERVTAWLQQVLPQDPVFHHWQN